MTVLGKIRAISLTIVVAALASLARRDRRGAEPGLHEAVGERHARQPARLSRHRQVGRDRPAAGGRRRARLQPADRRRGAAHLLAPLSDRREARPGERVPLRQHRRADRQLRRLCRGRSRLAQPASRRGDPERLRPRRGDPGLDRAARPGAVGDRCFARRGDHAEHDRSARRSPSSSGASTGSAAAATSTSLDIDLRGRLRPGHRQPPHHHRRGAGRAQGHDRRGAALGHQAARHQRRAASSLGDELQYWHNRRWRLRAA